MFNFPYCADQGLCRPWGFPVTGSEILVTQLPPYTGCSSCTQLTDVYHDLDILTSNCVLLLVCAASRFMDDEHMSVLGQFVSGYIGSFAVDWLVSGLLLCTFK